MLFLSLLSLSLVAIGDFAIVHLYVSPTGSDTNNGLSLDHSLKTLNAAVGRLHDDDVKDNVVFIELRKGYYDLENTVTLKEDLVHMLAIRAYNKEEVHVTGGKRLPTSLFHPVTDSAILQMLPGVAHKKVRQIRLQDVGISTSQLGHLERFGFAAKRTAPFEISYNGKPLRLARWPNDGSYVDVLTTPDGRRGNRFTYDAHKIGSREEKWKQEKDLWVYGYWYWGWADDSAHVASITPSNNTIIVDTHLYAGMRPGRVEPGVHGTFDNQGGYFNIFNALSELDEEGEYYMDKFTGIAYVWPPEHHGVIETNDVIYGSMINNLFEISHVPNILIKDLVLESCRHMAVVGQNLNMAHFERLEIRNVGSFGLSLTSCTNTTVRQCDIHDLDGGIVMNGGDRKTLTKSNNIVENNHIWQFSRAGAVGQHGVIIGGVGGLVQYNHIEHGRYTGIWWSGNDHTIRRNHVHHMCTGSSDCGGIHTGRDWTWRGNVISGNHIHHVLRYFPGAHVRGIMLDDQYSSVIIENNVFHDNELHINIGGGRDNIIRYNVFYNATYAGIGLDGRGLGKALNTGTLFQRLKAVPYHDALWSKKYPSLSHIDQEDPNSPRGNEIYTNMFYPGSAIDRIHYTGGSIRKTEYFNVHDNLMFVRPEEFNDRRRGDFRVICDAQDWAKHHGFPGPPTQAEVGPHLPIGPSFKHTSVNTATNGVLRQDCSVATVAPSTDVPRSPYVNDGSEPNTMTESLGCWLIVPKCPKHPNEAGTYRDAEGEKTHGALQNDTACLARAAVKWEACGSSTDSAIRAVYGPTGAWTEAGLGCYMGSYGCTSHGGSHAGGLTRDSYAEDHDGGATNEEACLSRAVNQWRYCGSSPNDPIVSVFRPKGSLRFAGAGCWIKALECPKDSTLPKFFFDAWGETNLYTGGDSETCFSRAQYFWEHCGSHHNAPVTAYFRPEAKSRTVP